MGMDITLRILDKNGKFLTEDIYDGRNREWFNNMSGKYTTDEAYNHLPLGYGTLDFFSNEWLEMEQDRDYFDFRYISVKEYRNWYMKYNPSFQAGWVNRYTDFLMKYKGYIPEYEIDLYHELDKDDIIEDMVWVEFNDKYDNTTWLYNYLDENNIPNDACIIYFFDY